MLDLTHGFAYLGFLFKFICTPLEALPQVLYGQKHDPDDIMYEVNKVGVQKYIELFIEFL